MSNYSIALSGLNAAQSTLDIIANNIANAATEGYHKQRVQLSPAFSSQQGSFLIGGGVNFEDVTRIIDNLLEQQILRQSYLLGHLSQELSTLRSVETSFGEFSDAGGLNDAINNLFNSFQDLSTHPNESIWQNQAVSSALTLAHKFNSLATFLSNLQTQITLEAENTIDQINTMAERIAELNDSIEKIEITGGQANNLRDQRDQCIAQLSELVGLETYDREHGVVDVTIAGMPLVIGTSEFQLQLGLDDNGQTGVGIVNSYNYKTDIQGGRLGGLLSLKNEIIDDIQTQLDNLAAAIILQVNQIHAQGVGPAGSFQELTGWTMISETLADFDPPINDGTIYVRVIDTTTGQVTRHSIDVDCSTDTLTTIAQKFDALTGLTASVTSSKLHIQAESGYEFDFTPAVLPDPTNSNLTAASPPTISVSGIYAGSENQTFICTVVGTGSIGNGNLQLEVKNGIGEVVKTLNIGEGYAAGDILDLADGIKILLTTGDLNDTDSFEIDAFADTDTSGLLSAIGINSFFDGSTAADMGLCQEIIDNPARIATAAGPEMTDNTNAQKFAALSEQSISSLNNMTIQDYYRRLVSDIGQDIATKEMSENSIEIMLQDLGTQRSQISGVNINDEAAQMLIFQQMFQAMAKYLNTIHTSISSLMEII